MKVPFVDHKLYTDALEIEPIPDNDTTKIKSKKDVILTKSRSSTVIANFVNHIFSVYNGKVYIRVKIKSTMFGSKLGAFVFTKKLGSSIHNSERNAKKRAKMRKKITEKKLRKTKSTVKKKTTISKPKKRK
jgi:small subunit ribosomal protein S19